MEKQAQKNIVLKGVAASPGIVIGEVFLFDRKIVEAKEQELKEEEEIGKELLRFKKALAETKREMINLRDKVARRIDPDHAKIFDAQIMILEDQWINQNVVSKIEETRRNAEYVYKQVIERMIQELSASRDEYIRERILDINEVGHRLLYNLLGIKRKTLETVDRQVILIARTLAPGDVVQMRREFILGFATDTGGGTSHVALLAKSLGIPAVVGLRDCFPRVENGMQVVLDGNKGEIILHPDQNTIQRYVQEKENLLAQSRRLLELKSLPAETLDGRRIELSANIELPSDVEQALEYGAEGVGLFRTEYLYLTRSDLPTEEEQYKAYLKVAQKMAPKSAILRTFDLGGDKFSKGLGDSYEANPFLGWRAIRACLDLPDLFKVQLRAMLRASALGNLKIMFPMISSLKELLRAKEILEEVKSELRSQDEPFDEKIQVGIMVEIPSAALLADSLAKECDFFSIGTNDLIQYTLAVDRGNEKISYLYQDFHPSVLKLIKEVIEAGHRNKIWVGLCGEMAGEPKAIPLLVGMGINELSTSPMAIPQVKNVIRSIKFKEAKKLVDKVLTLSQTEEIEKVLEDYCSQISLQCQTK
ncbi:MAG: phosphoenolpyruvate--protein phosphotransferase [candidate division Zixibacteria bacterium]|nr:phosphoenolpyruvate--protein phosphotransferase [candidate division Zixibacteria bacterium]